MSAQSEVDAAMETYRTITILATLTQAQWEFIEEIVASAYMTAKDIEFLDDWIQGKVAMSIKDMMAWLNAIDVRNKLLEQDMMEELWFHASDIRDKLIVRSSEV